MTGDPLGERLTAPAALKAVVEASVLRPENSTRSRTCTNVCPMALLTIEPRWVAKQLICIRAQEVQRGHDLALLTIEEANAAHPAHLEGHPS